MCLTIISGIMLFFNLGLVVFKKYNFAHFLITLNVLALVNGLNTWLYNFEVPQNKLSEFLSKFQMLGVSSKIIDIEKRLPENFA